MGNRQLGKNEIAVVNDAGEFEVIDLITGELVQSSGAPQARMAFDYATALMICQEVKNGRTLLDIGHDPKFPPLHVISHWQRTDRMFAEELKLARTERAEVHHDRALEIAQKAANREYSKDDVPAMALAVKTYQWAAERANPERYGSKVTHEGSTEKPILMRVVNTGINRSTKPDVVVEPIKEVIHEQGPKESRGSEDEESKGTHH